MSTGNLPLNKYQGFNSLPVVGTRDAIHRTKIEIDQSRSGTQMTLKTSLDKLNSSLMGGFRMNNIYGIVGASGSGKSYLLNQIRNDFVDPNLNGSYHKPIKILNFCLEMPLEDELIRTVSGKTGLSYGDLISSEKLLEDHEFQRVSNVLDTLDHPDMFFVETSGNRMQVYNTIVDFANANPGNQIIITYDHTLLTDEYDEKTEMEVIAKLSKMFMKLKKSSIDILVILLLQMNDKIEDVIRVQNKHLQYPTKKDIHGSKQVFWACDYIGILHRPELLNIKTYGMKGWDTENLIAWHIVKSRKGRTGMSRFKAEFEIGRISNW